MSDGFNLKIEIDPNSLKDILDEHRKQAEEDVYRATEIIARRTEAKIREIAADRLHSTFDTFTENLNFEEIAKGLYLIELDEKALWIEENVDRHSMVDDLLKNNPKTTKDGEKYKVIPFKHNKMPSQQTAKAREYTDQVKKELKNRNIPYQKIEFDRSGNPRLGLIHSINNINSSKPSKKAKHGALSGLAIYQTRGADGNIRRDIMTFRVVKESHKQEGLWVYPGKKGAFIFEEAYDWAVKQFDTMLEEINNQYKK